MLSAIASGPAIAVANTRFAPGATSWMISIIAVPSPAPGRPSWPGTVIVLAGRSPEAIDASLRSSLSDTTPTVTPAPVTLNHLRARSAAWACAPSDVTAPVLGAALVSAGDSPASGSKPVDSDDSIAV